MENSIDKLIKLLVMDILAKKELSNLNQDYITEKVNDFLKTHKKINEKLKTNDYAKFKRSQEYKEVVKRVRSELREVYGVFILKDYKKRFKLLEKLKKSPSLENHNKILTLHKSSKERLPYYPLIYKRIFEITGSQRRIVDLACGLNPFSYPYLSYKPDYLACDLAEKDLNFIKEYFKVMKIRGQTRKIDLIKIIKSNLRDIVKKNDLVFLFKTLDSLETLKKNISEQILKNIRSQFIVVSFSTKSLGGKKIIQKEKRAWFEKLIKKLSYNLNAFEVPGELFYIITK